jgi:hypothetical protein
MADLVKLISKVKYSDGSPAAVTLAPHNDGTFAAVIQRADDPKWGASQLWRREALTVSETDGKSWLGFAFTIPSPAHGPRLALQYNGPNVAVSVAPYGSWVSQQLWRLAYQDYQNQAARYAVLGMFDPVHPIFLNLFSGVAKDNQPVCAWTENEGKATVNEYWEMQTATWAIDGKKTAITEATGVEVPTPVSVVNTVFAAAQADRNYGQLLLAEPASVFDAAGYPIPTEYAVDFNKFYRAHSGVQALHAAIAAGQSLDSVVPSPFCTSCQIACVITAIGIAGVTAAGLAVLSSTAAPVVAVAALTSLGPQAALALTAFLVGTYGASLEILVYKLCEFIGIC